MKSKISVFPGLPNANCLLPTALCPFSPSFRLCQERLRRTLTGLSLCFTSSHLLTFLSSHLLLFSSSPFLIFSFSHLLLFSSSPFLIFSFSHLLLFSPSPFLTFSSLLPLTSYYLLHTTYFFHLLPQRLTYSIQ